MRIKVSQRTQHVEYGMYPYRCKLCIAFVKFPGTFGQTFWKVQSNLVTVPIDNNVAQWLVELHVEVLNLEV